MGIVEIEKNGKTISIEVGKARAEYEKAKRARREHRIKNKLGLVQTKSGNASRADKGKRRGSIATVPIKELTPEQFDLLIQKTNAEIDGEHILPERFRVVPLMRNHFGSLVGMIGKELALEVIAISPDIQKIKLILDPYGDMKR